MDTRSSGYHTLICEVLLLTYSDLACKGRKGGENFKNRQDALTFIESAWFDFLCEAIDLDADRVRSNLIKAILNRTAT